MGSGAAGGRKPAPEAAAAAASAAAFIAVGLALQGRIAGGDYI